MRTIFLLPNFMLLQKLLKFCIVLAPCVLFGCKHNENEHAITTLPEKNIKNIRLSSIIENYRFIPLESEPVEALINDRYGMKTIISDNFIYIVPTGIPSSDKIYVFSYPEGKFMYCHNKAGRGPGEYITISDFDVYGNIIYILNLDKILSYTYDGKFIRQFDLGIRSSNFRVIDENTFFIISQARLGDSEQKKIYIVNEQGDVINSKLEPKQSLRLKKIIDPLKLDKNNFFYQLGRSNDLVVYNIKEKSFRDERLVSQNILTHDEEEKHLLQQGLNQYGLNDYSTLKAIHITEMIGTNNDLFFTVRDTKHEAKETNYVMSITNGKIRHIIEKPYIDDITFTGLLLNTINYASSEQYFISFFNPDELKNGIQNYELDSSGEHYNWMKDIFTKKLREDDNIVLVEYRFK